jgi:hypothetical protein
MSERMRVAILTGCLFVIGLHFEQSAKLLLEVWRGPYANGAAALPIAASRAAGPDALADASTPAQRDAHAEWLAHAARNRR